MHLDQLASVLGTTFSIYDTLGLNFLDGQWTGLVINGALWRIRNWRKRYG